MASKYKSGDYAGTPTGYHRLGRSAPRTRVREYELRRRKLFIPQTIEAASSHHSHLSGSPLYRRAHDFCGVRPIELNHDSPFARGLVGWWPVGNKACWKSGKLLDLSPYQNHGTLTNMDPATDWVHDGERAGLDFDGVDDRVDVQQLPQVRPVTITAIVSFTNVNKSIHSVYCQSTFNSRPRLYVDLKNVPVGYEMRLYSGSYASPSSTMLLTANKWYCFCWTWDTDGSVNYYADGVNVGTTTRSISGTDGQASWGKIAQLSGFELEGVLSLCLLHNRALSAAEIKQLYEETKDGSYGSLEKKPVSIFFIPKLEEPQPFSIVRTPPKRQPAVRPLELNLDSPFAKGLVGWWPMGNRACWKSGKLLDLSPYGNHGTLTNMDPGTDWVVDEERAGLDFDGVDDVVTVAYRPELSLSNAGGTVLAFVNLAGFAASNNWSYSVVHKQANANPAASGSYMLAVHYLSGNFRVRGRLGDGSTWETVDGPNISAAGFQSIGMVWDSSSLAVYGNGSLLASISRTLNISDVNAQLRIGSDYLNAVLDDIRIYNRALSAAEIKQLYEETKDGGYGSLEKSSRAVFFFDQDTTVKPFFVRTERKTAQPAVRPLELNLDSPFARGLVGWWPMGNKTCWKSGKLLDLSPYGNHGTLTNMDPATDWVVDGERAGLDFDGVNDYATTGDVSTFEGLTGITAACWVYLRSAPTSHAMFSGQYWDGSDRSWLLGATDTSWRWLVATDTNNANNQVTANFTVGSWTHVCGTWDSSGTLLLYENGQLVRTGTSSGNTVRVNTASFTLGAADYAGSINYYVDGMLDSYLIYNRALSAAEIKQLYEETKDGSYGSLAKPTRSLVYFPETAPPSPPLAKRHRRRLSYPRRSRFPSWL